MHREPRVPEAEAQVGKWLDCRARITSKELAQLLSVKNGILRSSCSTSQKIDVNWEDKCSYAHRQADEQLSKKSKTSGDKIAVAILKITRQLGCVCQDMEPPKSSSILRKNSNILKPIRCVQITKAVVRHADIRDQNPSLGMICAGDPHQRNPNAPKFEDRQERCARDAAWRLAKNIKKRRNIKQHSSHLRRIGVCLHHQPLKHRKENFL